MHTSCKVGWVSPTAGSTTHQRMQLLDTSDLDNMHTSEQQINETNKLVVLVDPTVQLLRAFSGYIPMRPSVLLFLCDAALWQTYFLKEQTCQWEVSILHTMEYITRSNVTLQSLQPQSP